MIMIRAPIVIVMVMVPVIMVPAIVGMLDFNREHAVRKRGQAENQYKNDPERGRQQVTVLRRHAKHFGKSRVGDFACQGPFTVIASRPTTLMNNPLRHPHWL